jgi:hypothetical protein
MIEGRAAALRHLERQLFPMGHGLHLGLGAEQVSPRQGGLGRDQLRRLAGIDADRRAGGQKSQSRKGKGGCKAHGGILDVEYVHDQDIGR